MKVKELRRLLSCDSNLDMVDTSLIITDTLNIDKTALLIGDREVSSDEERSIFEKVNRLKEGEPVQYIVGKCEFMSLLFSVRAGVLIPRKDTEVLVEAVMERLPKDRCVSLMDMCCGSGCIGISISYYMKNILLSMCDVSDFAIDIAKENARNLIDRRDYKIHKKDILENFPKEEFDCIVSNPPYIRTDVIDGLDTKVKRYEPYIALDGGDDGYKFYQKIAKEANLKKGGFLAFEIGFDQGADVAYILNEQGYENVEVIKDIENRDRVVIGYRA